VLPAGSARERPMLDGLYLLLTIGFFGLAWAYARALDRL
jgi:hypothetical protein